MSETYQPLPRPFRLLFVGGHGHHYLRPYINQPEVAEVAALIDPYDPEAARHWARANNISKAFDSWEEASDWQPHAASIGVVYAKNGDEAAEALRRGLRTVTDKPAASDRTQLEALEAAADGKVLLTEFDMRCRPEFRAAREVVASGIIGEPLLATAQKSYVLGTRPPFYGDATLASGIGLWVMSHAVDLVQHVSGLELSVSGGLLGPPASDACRGMEACSAAVLRMGSGGVACCHADYLRPASSEGHGDDRLRVAGTRGIVEVREGKCILLDGSDAERTVESIDHSCRNMSQELLESVDRPGSQQIFNTANSLMVARLMLEIDEACQPPEPAR